MLHRRAFVAVFAMWMPLVACSGDDGGANFSAKPKGTGGASSEGSGGEGGGVSLGEGSTTGSSISPPGAGGGTSGGTPTVTCDPAPPAGSLYALSAVPLFADPDEAIPMCKYRGEVMLIVNTAALCGYTPQYEPLQKLEAMYKAQGLHVLGFLSDDFRQAGSKDQIDKCNKQYTVTFQQFDPIHVKSTPEPTATEKMPVQHPIFHWLATQKPNGAEATWNFNKWLIGRDGTLLKHWSESVEPAAEKNAAKKGEIQIAIEAALSKKL